MTYILNNPKNKIGSFKTLQRALFAIDNRLRKLKEDPAKFSRVFKDQPLKYTINQIDNGQNTCNYYCSVRYDHDQLFMSYYSETRR